MIPGIAPAIITRRPDAGGGVTLLGHHTWSAAGGGAISHIDLAEISDALAAGDLIVGVYFRASNTTRAVSGIAGWTYDALPLVGGWPAALIWGVTRARVTPDMDMSDLSFSAVGNSQDSAALSLFAFRGAREENPIEYYNARTSNTLSTPIPDITPSVVGSAVVAFVGGRLSSASPEDMETIYASMAFPHDDALESAFTGRAAGSGERFGAVCAAACRTNASGGQVFGTAIGSYGGGASAPHSGAVVLAVAPA